MSSRNNTAVQDTKTSIPVVVQQDPEATAAAAVAGQKAAKRKVRKTHASAIWAAVAAFALVLVVLLMFILQNGNSVALKFFSISGSLPLGVAMLLAACCGILLVAIPGTARILQLRKTARTHQQAAETAQAAAGITVPSQR